MSVAGFGVVKVKADLWAVRNNALSLDYSPNSAYDVNKAYRKGATIAYLGNIFIANEFIPPGTALSYGTSGATWRAASSSGAIYTGGITATPRTKYGPTTLVSTHENFRAPQKIEIVSFKIGSSENVTGDAQLGVFSFDSATQKFINGVSQVESITKNVMKEVILNTPFVVESGKYVGFHAFSSPLNGGCMPYDGVPAAANLYYFSGTSSMPSTTDTWTAGNSGYGPAISFTYKKV